VPRSPLPRRAAVTHAATASAGTAAPSPRRHVGIDDEEMDTMIECLIRLINDDFVLGHDCTDERVSHQAEWHPLARVQGRTRLDDTRAAATINATGLCHDGTH